MPVPGAGWKKMEPPEALTKWRTLRARQGRVENGPRLRQGRGSHRCDA